jgi:hypothetical protein
MAGRPERLALRAEGVTPFGNKRFIDWRQKTRTQTLFEFTLVFLCSYVVLFLWMPLYPYMYDEGIVLTAAMRVAAGQIPHRDFYANYGPAQFYVLSWLFKVFGESIFVERLYDLFIKAALVTSVYGIVSSYCRRSVAAGASLTTVLWLIGINLLAGTPQIPVSLLNIIGCALVLPLFVRNVATRRMFAAGAVAGVAALFRYDTGVALFGIQICVIVIAIWVKDGSNKLRTLGSTFWPNLLGFAVVTLPPALYYLSVAPVHAFVHDMIVYPVKYYHRGRNLPFPRINRRSLENLGIYLPVAVAVVSLYVAFAARLGVRRKDSHNLLEWQSCLVSFGLLTLVMYMKGFVRVGFGQMYLSIIPSVLLAAVLFEYRSTCIRFVQVSIVWLVCLCVIAATCDTRREARDPDVLHLSVAERTFLSLRDSPETQTWCNSNNALTRGLCFLPESDRIQTIEFIDSHTTPDQRLYVGTTKHDRIYANDNIIYFGAQRLPATHWSHFDPGLQNSYDIQTQMVQELNANAPPFIVLDSEFDGRREPNDSSKSTGVTLLDEYIHHKYQHVSTFGHMAIWQRVTAPGLQPLDRRR